jgi:hypothetical protein
LKEPTIRFKTEAKEVKHMETFSLEMANRVWINAGGELRVMDDPPDTTRDLEDSHCP